MDTKPSALPRPSSRLPVLNKARSAQGSAPQAPEPAPTAKTTTGASRVAKRASSATLSRTSQTPSKDAPTISKPVATRSNPPNGSKNASARASSTTGGTISSRAKQLKRPSSTIYARPPVNGDAEDHNDQLSSLDSFRSASRQGLRSASFEETPFDIQDDGDSPPDDTFKSRASRPSLSDRTIESLQSLPSTPKERRRSSFFNPVESPMGPPPRPASSLSRNGSNNSRPGTSDGNFVRPPSRSSSPAKKAPASAQPSSRTTSRVPSISSTTSSRRSVSGGFASKLQGAKLPTATIPSTPAKKSAAPLSNGHAARPSIGGKAAPTATRTAKPKPALGGQPAPAKRAEPAGTPGTAPGEPKRVVSNSSAALRQQIAAAKAAARKEKDAVKHDSPQGFHASEDDIKFAFDLHADPFNQAPRDEKHILRNRINTARMDGKLNIAAMGLKEIPVEVRQMYNAASMEESKVNWAEVVDLTRFIAADNEFEQLGDDVFPDRSAEDLSADEEGEGNQFGALELLDLHGNSLQNVPVGLRRLERLTTLNLSHNKLENPALDVVAQIKTLKELRLGNNSLTGNVPASICGLPYLEVLDLQANKLLGLPEALRELVALKVLNVSGNQLTALPMEAIQQLPLVELDASSNALIMSLVPLGGPSGHPTLQILNAANNSLAALTFYESLDMPQLRTLDVTNNHLTVLPAVTGWTELITLMSGDNKISDFPEGFTSLRKLRNVNLSSNEIRLVDPEIGRMDSLESLILASNPLREKKFLTMTAADIKRDLKSRLAPEVDDAVDLDEPTSPVTVIGDYERPSSMWSLKASGVLDLASKDLSDDLSPVLGSFLNSNEVRQILLQLNKITCIPPALWMGQELRVLDLSDNIMSADYLSDELLLPSLQELNLSKCRISSFEPLTSQLQAPSLRVLNVSTNRLAGSLPALRSTYPQLTTLFASDNRMTSISADALRGMNTVNLSSNDIEQLPAEVGLLWDEGLKNFDVGSNAFRVPNYRLLEKGTEATLRWLRDRLPASGGVEKGA
ncbi:hypothetical protein M409DRAFT_22591 [Zasmidium cellare ATCC 36951]|uniref:L domain-like protein n=1 Tax=Zasmidium cellare ATCC 36951 TaxID=1080233 RepID=A0A6A6CKM2_ZASCE|nr:uncharacterized protein M409DRAFT_22591 [Zasmidium cellare ATCC 36951]KAF2167163.1 hypothetical protein M409DRAFT_22591 [Zasmidium cellare ATCC 36951]